MSLVFTRPDVSDLVFHVYERPIHPELLQIYDELVLVEDDFSCVIRIHDAGHSIEFRSFDTVVTEVMTSKFSPLPSKRLALHHTVRGCRDSACRFHEELDYQSSFQVERLDAEIYQNFHQELRYDFRRASLAREFPGQGRFSPGAISLIRTEICNDSFLIHTFHTYPDNGAVVKTQTLFEFPGV